MSKHVWHIKYRIEPGKFTRKELEDGDYGGTDKIMIGSKIEDPDGSASFAFVGADGIDGGELSKKDWFQFWGVLAGNLADVLPFGPDQELAALVMQKIRERAREQRARPPKRVVIEGEIKV